MIHAHPKGLRIDFREPVNLDGGKNYNFIFTNLKLKFAFSFNKECRKQSNLWPLDSRNVR